MSKVSASLIKELREQTGAGMLDCKEALVECEGSIEKAIEWLRKKGLKSLGKKAGRVAAEGTLGSYVHSGDQVAAIVELNCETDFVARGDAFKEVARGIAMHVAALKPMYLSEADVPEETINNEKRIAEEQLTDVQKKNADKIIPGKLRKFFEEVVLLNQPYIKDDSGKKTVKDVLDELSLKCGEKVALRRFERFEVGEGIEKKAANLSEDVAALTGNL